MTEGHYQRALLQIMNLEHEHSEPDAVDLSEYLLQFVMLVSATLGVSRVSIWNFDHAQVRLVPLVAYSSEVGLFTENTVLPFDDFPEYFNTLIQNVKIVANDARHNPRTSEFATGYLEKLGITSMLDIPIRSQGRVVGVVCMEHTGEQRQWRQEEEEFAMLAGSALAHYFLNRQLLESEQQKTKAFNELESLIELANNLIISCDLNGTITRWNAKAEVVTGYSRHERIGTNLLGYDTVLQMPGVEQLFGQILQGHRVDSLEFDLIRSDGQAVSLLLSLAPRFGYDGKIVGLMIMGIETTHIREKEALLRETQKIQALTRMAGGIAHDFSDLLTAISGDLWLLKQQSATDPGSDSLWENTFKTVESGNELTRKLLSFSKTREIDAQETDFAALVAQLVQTYEGFVGEQINFTFNRDGADSKVMLDQASFEHVFVNLLLNSRDALPGGGLINISVDVISQSALPKAVEIKTDTGRVVRLTIEDNGTGIESKQLSRVFEPYFTTKQDRLASGLGMTMVQAYCEQSGGGCHIFSEPGVGTKVRLFFPVTMVSEEPVNLIPRILVVEDNPQVLEITMLTLKRVGYEVQGLETADEAIIQLKAGGEWDLILTDILMPGENSGIDLAKWVIAARPGIKVVMMTGYAGDLQALNQVDLPLLQKPYSTPEMINCIGELLGEKRLA